MQLESGQRAIRFLQENRTYSGRIGPLIDLLRLRGGFAGVDASSQDVLHYHVHAPRLQPPPPPSPTPSPPPPPPPHHHHHEVV